LDHTNNFGKLVRRIQKDLMLGATTFEVYEEINNEGYWAPDSLHEAIKQAMKGLE
jgi:hypothetical protein